MFFEWCATSTLCTTIRTIYFFTVQGWEKHTAKLKKHPDFLDVRILDGSLLITYFYSNHGDITWKCLIVRRACYRPICPNWSDHENLHYLCYIVFPKMDVTHKGLVRYYRLIQCQIYISLATRNLNRIWLRVNFLSHRLNMPHDDDQKCKEYQR